MVVPFLPYIVVGITHLVAILAGADAVVAVTKPLLMPALLLALLLALPSRRGETVVLASLGILFGWLGDLSLMDVGPGFVVGLAFFLLGHVAYIVLFVRRLRVRRLPRWWSAVYVPWFAGLLAVLAPHAGGLLVPLALYGLALAVLGITGPALLAFSYSLLGLDRLLPSFAMPQVDFAIMLTYIAAQGLICWGVVRQSRAVVAVPSLA